MIIYGSGKKEIKVYGSGGKPEQKRLKLKRMA